MLLAELDEEDEESADRIDAAVTRRGGRVFRTSREVSKVEEVRHHVERKLTRKPPALKRILQLMKRSEIICTDPQGRRHRNS